MITLDRRSFVTGTAGFALLAPLSHRALAQNGGILRIAIAAEVGDLDLLTNVSSLSSYTAIFDPLIRYGPCGAPQPALAEAWTVAPDALSIAFTLRQGVIFSDGTPFDADAAAFNLKRWIGKPDFSWIGVSDAYDGLVVDGPYKIAVKLKRPVPAALLEMTVVRPVRFISPKAVDAKGAQTAPVGTGPWKVVSNDASGLTLERNDAYWGEKPKLARLEMKVVPDELARANGLRSGDLDVIGGDWVAPLSPRRAKALKSQGVAVVNEPGTATMLLGYSPKSTMVAEKAVRQAIYLGIERAAVAGILFEGYADPAADLFPAIIPQSGARHPVPKRDVAAAKALLSGAGWSVAGAGWTKNGKTLAIDILVSEEALPGSRRIAEMVQGQLTEIGFKVGISSVDNATMHERRPAFQYDLTFFTTYGAPYDPHGTLGNSFMSSVDSGPDGKIYVSQTLDPLVLGALTASGQDRDKKMQVLYDWLDDNRAICPLVVPQRIWAHGARVRDFALPATDYDLPFQGITVSA